MERLLKKKEKLAKERKIVQDFIFSFHFIYQNKSCNLLFDVSSPFSLLSTAFFRLHSSDQYNNEETM